MANAERLATLIYLLDDLIKVSGREEPRGLDDAYEDGEEWAHEHAASLAGDVMAIRAVASEFLVDDWGADSVINWPSFRRSVAVRVRDTAHGFLRRKKVGTWDEFVSMHEETSEDDGSPIVFLRGSDDKFPIGLSEREHEAFAWCLKQLRNVVPPTDLIRIGPAPVEDPPASNAAPSRRSKEPKEPKMIDWAAYWLHEPGKYAQKEIAKMVAKSSRVPRNQGQISESLRLCREWLEAGKLPPERPQELPG